MYKFALHRHLGNPTVVQGSDVTVREIGATWVIQWDIKPDRGVIRIGDLEIRLLWRNEAYNYWPMELSAPEPIGNFTSPSKELVIVEAVILVRTAHINKRQLWLTRRKLVTSDHKCRIVSKGIRNHNRLNYIALTLWALDSQGVKLGSLALVRTSIIRSGYTKPQAKARCILVGRYETVKMSSRFRIPKESWYHEPNSL
jgi:hypothetical protein